MKKLTALWMMIGMLGMSLPAMGAMSMSKMRENARFLTDRMAYELNLSPMQYDDVYEVNYDFIDNVRYIMNDVVRGYGYAVERYYEFLDYRNDDLRWILSSLQYRRFMGVEYFYRPIYTTSRNWFFRIYQTYRDVNHFYYAKPHHYKTYKGGHYRTHFGHVSFYKNHRKEHYKHDFYQGDIRFHRKDKPQDRPKVHNQPFPQKRNDVKKEVKRNVRNESKPVNRKEVKQDNRRKREAVPSRSSHRREGQEGRRAAVRQR